MSNKTSYLQKNIILSSKSPRRKEILEKFGFLVKVIIPSSVIEISLCDEFETPEKVVMENSKRKAESIFLKDSIIIASDTIVILNGKLYGKPSNKNEAFNFLKELSGQTHEVYSSYTIKFNEEEFTGYDVSFVTFHNLTDEEILKYMNDVYVMDKAGAYAIQDGGEKIVKKLEGSFYNVMGLPIEKILNILDNWF